MRRNQKALEGGQDVSVHFGDGVASGVEVEVEVGGGGMVLRASCMNRVSRRVGEGILMMFLFFDEFLYLGLLLLLKGFVEVISTS